MKHRSCTTAFGFDFGALIVERMWHHKGYVAVRIRTAHDDGVIVQSSPTGRVLHVQRLEKKRKRKT